MGTPEFAVPCLNILLENGYDIAAVVTAPDKPGGRLGMMASPVKQFALSKGLLVLQPEKLRNPEFLETLRSLRADMQVVVAFRMLPEMVWNMPPKGTMNLHASLLPRYRGAAPINWAIINGEKETGLSTFLLQHDIDTGDVLFQETLPIGENETAGELHDRMMAAGAKLVLKSVKAIEAGTAQPRPQADVQATHAPKIFTADCTIDFNRKMSDVHNFVRGLSPYPGAWTTFEGKTVKILRTLKSPQFTSGTPGQWYSDGKNTLHIGCSDGCVQVLELQMEGKKRLETEEFLRGFKYAWTPLTV
ncbi:MAG: methionyl-tRNA formyltransferase [Saprospiraceae bacterium]|nr:methionyl-tRNA formyltransferase [Saprospiraceae bacterium]